MSSIDSHSGFLRSKLKWWFAWLVVMCMAVLGRFWRLSDFPAGLHQDEAWFAYNAWLLLKSGSNIYGEKWPLTVDMWGDHVSAIHSYVLVPFIALFGAQTAAFRTGIIVCGLVAAGFALHWLYRQTQNKLLTLLAAAMLALSPWAIVMSRASSSVIVDSAVLSLLVVVATAVFMKAASSRLASRQEKTRFLVGLLAVYCLTIVCYVTYFTSRLLVPPFLVGIVLYTWWSYRDQWSKLMTLGAVAVIGAYLVFPFGYFLQTPYAQGRYQETAIIGSDTVTGNLTAHIAQAGQAGISPLITRLRYNKVTENLAAFWGQYVGLWSPSVLLFQNGPPIRYAVPGGASVTIFEYVGVVLAVAYLFLGTKIQTESIPAVFKTRDTELRPLITLLLLFVLSAAVPSALTQDDFPNLQRAVIMVPWLQLVAALGWFVTMRNLFTMQWVNTVSFIRNFFTSPGWLVLIICLLSAPSLIGFWFGYVAQAPFERPFNRSRAGEELAKWINHNAHDAKIIQEHVEGVFFYPYLFNQEDLRQYPIQKPGKYFLNARDFWIGERHFVSDLCASSELTAQPYEYYIFFTLHNRCPKVGTMKKVFEAKYDDGSTGFTVYQPVATAAASVQE